ncbi:MAG: hypothetical protein RL748_4395 [Pseudomonadota bacterium]|jgi:GT2 family glycosyltransferase
MPITHQSVVTSQLQATIVAPTQQDKNIFDFFLRSVLTTINSNIELIIIMDGAQPSVAGVIAKQLPAFAAANIPITVVANEIPKGWEWCINWAIKNRRGEHLITVDSDVILTEDWIGPLLAHFSPGSKVGAVSGVLCYPQTGGVQHCGVVFSEDNARHVYLNMQPDALPLQAFQVQCVIGALCAVSASALEHVGMMDESYFNAYSDFDYFMRIGAAGFSIMIDPRVRAYHWERSSGIHRISSRKTNLARFWRQWGNQIKPDLWQFIGEAVNRFSKTYNFSEKEFYAIDLAASRYESRIFWTKLAEWGITWCGKDDWSHAISGLSELWLPAILGSDGHRHSRPFLILVDNFVSLLGNHYWAKSRAVFREDDIVMDLYGNIVSFQKLQEKSWPGHKVR